MKKNKIIKNFLRMPHIEQKERFMKENGIEYTCDEFNNFTVYADDGTLQLFPVERKE